MTLLRIFSSTFGKVKSVFTFIFGLFYQIFCCRKYRRKSESLLPITLTSSSFDQTKSFDLNYNKNYSNSTAFNKSNFDDRDSQLSQVNQSNLGKEECEDFFKDMTPTFTRQKKIFIQTNSTNEKTNITHLDKFYGNSELGILDETIGFETSWEDETNAEVSESVDSHLRMARKMERERRLAEHKRIKTEKEMKKFKNLKNNLTAIKLS